MAESIEQLNFHAPTEDNLIVERPKVSRIKQEVVYPELPKPKERKSILSGRVGISSEKRKASIAVNVGIPTKCAKSNIIEGFQAFDIEDVYDIPIHNDVIIVEETNRDKDKKSSLEKRRKILFSEEEKLAILDNQMLTDESINIAQNIIHKQFPNIGGLQDTVIGKTQFFGVVNDLLIPTFKFFT